MLSKRSYEEKLNDIVSDIFGQFRAFNNERIGRLAGLSTSTVYRVRTLRTYLPRYRTVLALAKAAGFEVCFARPKSKFRSA